ncbi:uncharacterized protein Pyn_04610 [Prunus yedoensis var. nudiflora]|uniref:Uncharacterized protein n=1 Tax=Prunus yedoensis var. nudiflora TaxID=2094558 RepID=A0A314ZSU3_PRUYE|nr:uncharacterized protein Pyn_04610 [Prunus yedoensis var. nudiflora]
MAIYQGFMREEKVFCHFRPVLYGHVYPAEERHTIIQDCHGVLYGHVYPAEEVSYFPAPAMRDEYHGGQPTKTVTVRPPPPPQQVQYYPYPNMDQNHVPPPPHQIRRPVKTEEVPAQKPHQKKGGVLNSIEAAKVRGSVNY